MGRRFTTLILALLVSAGLALAAEGAWTGVVSDDHCGASHAKASEKAASCVAKCVSGGARYTLVSEGKVYQLDAQDKFKDFAGKSVKVAGSEKDGMITVASVEAADDQ